MVRRGVLPAALVVSLIYPAAVAAQDTPLSKILPQLIQAEIFLAPPQGGFSHEAHFVPGVTQQLAPLFFNQQIITQLSTFPTGSSSGGFSYTFDPQLGTFARATDSFGPAFAERALTVGRGRLTFGVNFQRSSYKSFEGVDLENGDVRFFLRHSDTGGFFFEGDLIQAALQLDLSTTTTSVFVNYGVTDRLDVSVGVPIVRASLDAVIDATVIQLATEGSNPPIHEFEGGGTTQRFTDGGSKTGIGDILVRAKMRVLPREGGGLAIEVGARLPTGDSENLLGAGAPQFVVGVIGSSAMGRIAPHFNAGFTVSGNSDLVDMPNEFNYRVGSEFVASPKVTLSADLIGRTLIDVGRLELGPTTFEFTHNGTPGTQVFQEFQRREGSLNSMILAAGGKFNVASNVLFSANLLFGLNSAGFRAGITPVFGLDFSY